MSLDSSALGSVSRSLDDLVDRLRELAADTSDGWIQAWSLTFSIPALVLLDDPDTVRAVTDRLSPTGPGIAHVDCHMDGCRSWARATAGEPGAYQRLTQARAELLARGDTLFWLILTLAAARIIVDDDADEAAALVAAASGPIEELGLDGLRPWLIDLPSRLPARS